ncbi:hypothetical protein VB734_07065 [Synechococcus sp. BA-124 BA4]|uniref:hypothetical protein n=1 Tax=unclassified Synechococcus TaxID=2626047 RepID=UPI0018CD5D48|nr:MULTISPECIES: hypothetical protein [unclassified Synechococcus]MEA5399793.1 hypothetical protein [Synechococcus sp. BA-124 BA4]QPN56726.1 hypothetical protein I1E95_00470 [Synechococcus sp. CBW1107]CAK6696019.1 hypothetical protein BBFGKLBO_01966 [Synechococcus sp. CBW1107]
MISRLRVSATFIVDSLNPLLDLLWCSALVAGQFLPGFLQRLAPLSQQLQIPQKPAEPELLHTGLLRIACRCPWSLLLVFLPGRQTRQGGLAARNRFPLGDRTLLHRSSSCHFRKASES